MTLRSSAPHKRPRWLALFAIVILVSGLAVPTALAHLADAIPPGSFVQDDLGANDEPGQKDLTAQASAFHDGSFYTAWKWDDTSWSGKNTGDGCSLFTSDGDEFVDYAVCVTIGGKTPALQTVTVYSCSDGRTDRCTNPVLLATFSTTAGTYCLITNDVAGPFDGADTQATCNISAIAAFFDPDISALAGSSLLNTCSYPSREPNSDPSDCVLEAPANVDVNLGTVSSGTITWQATLNDTATLTPAGTGSVTFKLYSGTPCSDDATTGNLLQTNTDASAPFDATPFVVTNTDVTGPGPWTYYWTVTYNPDSGFNGDTELCDEVTTITASVVGTTKP